MTLDSTVTTTRFIDMHAHLAPPALMQQLAEPGGVDSVALETVGAARRIRLGPRLGARLDRSLEDLDDRLAFLDRHEIETQVVSPWIELLGYELPPADGLSFSRRVNRAMAEAVQHHPDRLVALGTVPLQCGGDAAATVLREAVLDLGLAGVQIGTHVPASSLASQDLIPFWREAERLRAIVFVHPHYADELRELESPVLEFAIANPADTTLALAGLMFSGRLAEHPELRVVLSHGGGFLPFQIGRLDAAWARLGRESEPSPSQLLARLYVDTIVHGSGALDLVIDQLGVDRVVMGTDYPFSLGDLTPRASLSASSRAVNAGARVRAETARRLLSDVRSTR